MEIGNKSMHMGWKFIIGYAVFTGVLYTLILWMFNSLSNVIDYSLTEILVQGAIFGLIFALIFPFVLNKLGKRLSNSEKYKIIPELDNDEHIEIYGPANIFRGIEGVGGKLFLTNKNVIFKSHKINIQTGQTKMDYADIHTIHKLKTLGFIENKMRIETKDGKTHDFVVNERDLWVEKLEERMS